MIIFARKHYSGNQSGLFSLFINLAIFFRGFLTVLANLFSSSYLFIIDALLGFGGIYFITRYWEDMIKYTTHYYPQQFMFIVVPTYILIWICSTFLNGGYDKPFRISNIFRGIFFGTLAIAAVYAFLPNEWRFSRAIIILGAAWIAFEMLLTRALYHLIKYQSLSIESEDEKRTLLVGSEDECLRAEKLLLQTGANSEIVSFVSQQNELKQLAAVYDINEIIFCSRDLSFGQIIVDIGLCGNKTDYKILNPGSAAFIGSNSKNSAGDLYSFNHNLNLSKPANQRKKRLFDVVSSLLFIPLLPVNLFVVKSFGKFFSNWVEVLFGKKTWIGYTQPANNNLPFIKPAVISSSSGISSAQLNADVLSKVDLLYARHYSVGHDLRLMLQNYRKLGS
jgi:hypothetical protein